jgi:predicted ATP-dependent endonuclease of OLD family
VHLLTFVHTAPEGSILLIDDPEVHLHPQAVRRLREIIERCARDQRKQFILATHSLTMIDAVPFERIIYVQLENGATQVLETKNYRDVESLLGAAGVSKSSILAPTRLKLALLVEGRDDAKVWRQFLIKEGVDPSQEPIEIIPGKNSGGREEVLASCDLLSRIGHPYYAVLDQDAEQTVREKFHKLRLREQNLRFLSKGEIEDYLVDPTAIAALLNRPRQDVELLLARVGGRGKQRLDAVLRDLNITKVSSEVKELLALQLRELPVEISSLIREISSRLDAIKNSS